MDKRKEITKMVEEWASENKERAVFSMMTDEDNNIQFRLRGKGINVITSLASVMDYREDNYQAIMNAVAILHKKRGMKARVKLAWDILRGKLFWKTVNYGKSENEGTGQEQVWRN